MNCILDKLAGSGTVSSCLRIPVMKMLNTGICYTEEANRSKKEPTLRINIKEQQLSYYVDGFSNLREG